MTTNSIADISWDTLLQSIQNVLKGNEVNEIEICRLLSTYKSKEKDWMKYVFFEEESFTRNLVDEGNGNYNLIIFAWNPSQGTSIHSHSNSRCFVKILSGAIRETRYETPEEGKPFTEIENHIRERDDITFIEDSIGVHEMKNDSANQAISLHLYIPPFHTCQCYDRETGEKRTSPLKFTSTFGVLNTAVSETATALKKTRC